MPVIHALTRFTDLSFRDWIKKLAVFLAVTLSLGWLYAWASPRVFPRDTRFGFKYGVAHGGLMPMALPSLVMGKNVEIFAANNSGRPYKIGYIVGINVCGLVVFGSAFWRPKGTVIKNRI